MNPKHIGEVPAHRRAIAPYNFVELPDTVVEAELPLPEGDRYHPDYHTGRIECTLTTESPLYIRCGLTTKEFQAIKEAKDLPDFFYTDPASKSEKPVLPGSSLRGMLRTLVEIVSFSKIDRVTDNKLFYRSLGDPALRDIYQANFVENLGKVQVPPHPQSDCYRAKVNAGFLRKRNNYYVIEEYGYGRIDRHTINRVIPNLANYPNIPTKPLYQGSKQGKTPSWTYQHQTIYVEMDEHEQNYFFPRQINSNGKERHPNLYLRFRKVHSASFTPVPDLQKGTLVITGDMQHKHLEFVFLDEKLNEHPVSDEMVRRFQDDDQVTKWQEDAFPKDNPTPNCRQQKGYLREREPVFFLLNEDGKTVRFFGRAQMFRLPYDLSPLDLVPESLKDYSVRDLPDTIFGYVNGKGRDVARASRVFVGDATCVSSGNVWWKGDSEKITTPKILASPKPTTFQHYLVQTSTDRTQLKHYSPQPEQNKTVLRGHKLYWHKPHGHEDIEETDTAEIEKKKSQYTNIKPIKAGISFKFYIRFENLSKVELGALLWVLSLSSDKSQTLKTGKEGEKYCFSLGMGKPLGMGAVNIDYELHLSDRKERYKNLFNGTKWKTGEEDQSQTPEKEEECVKAFEKYILDWISCQDYPKDRDREQLQHLKQLPRIEMLLAMLQCEGLQNSLHAEYMTIEPNEYKERRVLPTPLQIARIDDNRRVAPTFSPSTLPSVVVKSERQVEIAKAVKSKKFEIGQILEATVARINSNHVTYHMLEVLKLTEKEPKKAALLREGQAVHVKITALKEDGSIKSVKCAD
ncbi:TIGR03986 family CRISPR-associated RAMP protein [Microcoleus sp. T2B6]|uniref:TIGR03986 family type III CRISPR-associated RAMP protein n=1 Tax=Microcoleus sp. T2B6 TaxID=3055424 RepID=UPI002FD07122